MLAATQNARGGEKIRLARGIADRGAEYLPLYSGGMSEREIVC